MFSCVCFDIPHKCLLSDKKCVILVCVDMTNRAGPMTWTFDIGSRLSLTRMQKYLGSKELDEHWDSLTGDEHLDMPRLACPAEAVEHKRSLLHDGEEGAVVVVERK